MVFPNSVLVRIYRPEGYEDVCDELVVEDAMKGSDFRYEIIKKENSTFDSTVKSGAA